MNNKINSSKLTDYKTKHYAVYEKVPAHGKDVDGIVLAPFKTKEEAENARKKYGYITENYYVDILNYE